MVQHFSSSNCLKIQQNEKSTQNYNSMCLCPYYFNCFKEFLDVIIYKQCQKHYIMYACFLLQTYLSTRRGRVHILLLK